jgi:hypothetical protein
MYLHEPQEKTEAMIRGINFHKKCEIEIKHNKKLAIGNTRLSFDNPEPELKVYIPYNDYYDLSAVFDCVDGDTLYEFKTGSTSAFEYATGFQIPFYFLTLHKMGRDIKRAYIIRYNEEEGKTDLVVVRNTKKKRESAQNFIDTLAPEVYNFFSDKNLL